MGLVRTKGCVCCWGGSVWDMGALLPGDCFHLEQEELCLAALRVGLSSRLPSKPPFSSFSAGWSLGCDPELPCRAAGHLWGQERAAGDRNGLLGTPGDRNVLLGTGTG